jgi:predicted NUDIX family NTP pyrophosphohydrolase
MKRLICLAIAVGLMVALLASDAQAEGINLHSNLDGGTVTATSPGHGGGRGRATAKSRAAARGESPYVGCVMRDQANLWASRLSELFGGSSIAAAYHGGAGVRVCRRKDGAADDLMLVKPGAAAPAPAVPAADVLARSASSQLVLDLPEVATSPPRGGTQLVGVPVWFWVTNTRPASATAAVPGLSATLTAEPVATRVELGDGTTLACEGPGTAYDAARPSAGQHSSCSHAFDDAGPATVRATVEWGLRWTASDGQQGTLPTVARTTTFTLTIEEAQAVTD